jgi:hypothetical protein
VVSRTREAAEQFLAAKTKAKQQELGEALRVACQPFYRFDLERRKAEKEATA